jgi:hypothetical protein
MKIPMRLLTMSRSACGAVDGSLEPAIMGAMPPKLDAAVPTEALRDLIGICRALYAAWTKSCVGPMELEELASIGKELNKALELAKSTRVNTVGHRAAWARAEEATKRLGLLVNSLELLHPALHAASERVVGAPEPRSVGAAAERAAKSHHSRRRG